MDYENLPLAKASDINIGDIIAIKKDGHNPIADWTQAVVVGFETEYIKVNFLGFTNWQCAFINGNIISDYKLGYPARMVERSNITGEFYPIIK